MNTDRAPTGVFGLFMFGKLALFSVNSPSFFQASEMTTKKKNARKMQAAKFQTPSYVLNREAEVYTGAIKPVSTNSIMRPIEKNEQFKENLEAAAEDKEMKDLLFHEQGLKENADGMYAFALHLFHIKNKVLWKRAGFNSFSEYCDKRLPELYTFKLSKPRLYQLAEWASISEQITEETANASENEGVSTIVESSVLTENVARELSRVPKSERVRVLTEASKGGKATAKKVKEIAQKKVESAEFEVVLPRDMNGKEVPKEKLDEWNRWLTLSKDLKERVNVIRGEYKKQTPFGKLPKDVLTTLGDIYANLDIELDSDNNIISHSPWQ